MRRCSVPFGVRVMALLFGVWAAACGSTSGPKTGTQTNWLSSCQSDADCDGLECVCGICTETCNNADDCPNLPGASCADAQDAEAIAVCSGSISSVAGLCLLPCPRQGCPGGTSCLSGVCAPTPEPTAVVTVDASRKSQTLSGIGASILYVSDEIVQHPRKRQLLDAMFSDTGFSVLRLRNNFGQEPPVSLASSGELVEAATERLGRTPLVLLSSLSPPDSLKASGSSWCDTERTLCTLKKLPDGTFDYAGLASHWRATLDAYAQAGILPDYISIQNSPDWVPAEGTTVEACRFLPTQGTEAITTDAGTVTTEYPGYAEALDAIVGQFAGLASPPRVMAPETTTVAAVAEYLTALDLGSVDAISHHYYDTDTTRVAPDALLELGALAESHRRPLFQSETQADGLTTAVLMHAALAVEGATVYVQNGFVESASVTNPDGTALINLSDEDFELGDTYHVMRHYSLALGPDWVRVAADSDAQGVLSSAWLSPDTERLVVVLTNPENEQQVVRLEPSADPPGSSTVLRTVLRGVERLAELGPLPPEGVVVLPGQSMATVTLRR